MKGTTLGTPLARGHQRAVNHPNLQLVSILHPRIYQAMKVTTLGTLLIRGHQRAVMVIPPGLPLVSILHPRIL